MNNHSVSFLRLQAILVCLVLTAGSVAISQTYVVSMTTGASPYTGIRPDAALLMSDPADDSLTQWQDLPFVWSFFGREVTGYRVSDNGYITFDSSESASIPRNTSLPSTDAPRNAIFAFWDSLRLARDASLWSNEIRAKTFGTAPDRVHVVMWVSATPSNVVGSGSLSFALAMYEGGGFDVIQVAGRPGGRTTGTIGAQNAEATMGTMLPGSPNIPYPSLTASADDDIVYRFTWSSVRRNAAMLQIELPPALQVGIPVTLKGEVLNAGADTISSLTVHCRVDGHPVWSTTRTGLEVKGNESLSWTLTEAWTPDIPGEVTRVTAWVEIEGDERRSDDTLSRNVLTILGRMTDRRPLVEEFTGAWCGWCPDGALQMEGIEETYPQAVLVSIHAGTQPDQMKTALGMELATTYNAAFPQALVDRHLFPGETRVPLDRTGQAWMTRTGERLAAKAPAFLQVSPNYDPGARRVTATIAMTCADYIAPDDYRLHVLVVENEVAGSGPGWDQVNYFSNHPTYPGHPFYALPNPVTGYVHRHVLRGSLTGTWGDSGRIPARLEAEQTYTFEVEGVLDQEIDPERVRLVAFVSRHGILLADRNVINATEAPLLPASIDRGRSRSAAEAIRPVPSPAHGRVDLRMTMDRPALLTGELIDMVGQTATTFRHHVVEAGPCVVPIDISRCSPGVYIARIVVDDRLLTGRIVVY